MPRGDNLTKEMRARGGRNSHSGGRKSTTGRKGGEVRAKTDKIT